MTAIITQFNIIAKKQWLVNPFLEKTWNFFEKRKIFLIFLQKTLAIGKKMCYNTWMYGQWWQRTLSGAVATTASIYKGVKDLPNIKSAKKRVKVTASKTMQNKMFRTQLKTDIKKYEAAVAAGDVALAQETYKAAVKKLDQAVARGQLHTNAAARNKSQFTKKLTALA